MWLEQNDQPNILPVGYMSLQAVAYRHDAEMSGDNASIGANGYELSR